MDVGRKGFVGEGVRRELRDWVIVSSVEERERRRKSVGGLGNWLDSGGWRWGEKRGDGGVYLGGRFG